MAHRSIGRRSIVFCFLFFVSCVLFSASCHAAPSDELIANAARYDGKEIWYQGELVGSKMRRGDFVWMNLNDGANAIGVWAKGSAADMARVAGSHRYRGDLVAVSGIFHRSCAEHGGVLDIHAQQVILLKKGYKVFYRIEAEKIIALIVLLGVLACLLIIHILEEKRKSR